LECIPLRIQTTSDLWMSNNLFSEIAIFPPRESKFQFEFVRVSVCWLHLVLHLVLQLFAVCSQQQTFHRCSRDEWDWFFMAGWASFLRRNSFEGNSCDLPTTSFPSSKTNVSEKFDPIL
jgi:hypothetical protein